MTTHRTTSERSYHRATEIRSLEEKNRDLSGISFNCRPELCITLKISHLHSYRRKLEK